MGFQCLVPSSPSQLEVNAHPRIFKNIAQGNTVFYLVGQFGKRGFRSLDSFLRSQEINVGSSYLPSMPILIMHPGIEAITSAWSADPGNQMEANFD